MENYAPAPFEKIGSFYIDSNIGRDVKIQIDYGLAVSIDKVMLGNIDSDLFLDNIHIE